MSYVSDCVDFILNELENFEGEEVHACDLGYTLTEDANNTGSITCNSYQAREIVTAWGADDRGALERYTEDIGFSMADISYEDEPEKYHVIGIINGVDSLLSSCDYISDRWNEKIELTREAIDTIKYEVENNASIHF